MEKPKIEDVISKLEKEDPAKWKAKNNDYYPFDIGQSYTLKINALEFVMKETEIFLNVYGETNYSLHITSKDNPATIGYDTKDEQAMIKKLFQVIDKFYTDENIRRQKESRRQEQEKKNPYEEKLARDLGTFLKS